MRCPTAQGEQVQRALQALADPQAFAARYGVPAGTPPMLFAVGDGNHSLATAKSIWDRMPRPRSACTIRAATRWSRWRTSTTRRWTSQPIHRLLFGVPRRSPPGAGRAIRRAACAASTWPRPKRCAAREGAAAAAPGRRPDRPGRALQRDRDRRAAIVAGGGHAAGVRRPLHRARRRRAGRLRARRRRARTPGAAARLRRPAPGRAWARASCSPRGAATARCRARPSRWARPTRSASTSRRGASADHTAVWPGSCRVTGCELDSPPSTTMAWPLT